MPAHGINEFGQDGSPVHQAVKATQSGSQAGSASHNTVHSASGAGDQEVDSQAGPSSTLAPRVSAAQKALAEELKDELLFRLPDPLMAPIREECAAAFNTQNERIQGLETRLARMEAKLDLLLHHFLEPPQHPPPPPPLPPPPPPPPSPQNNPNSDPHLDSPHHSPSPHNSPSHTPSPSPSHSHSPSPSPSPTHSPPLDFDTHTSSPPPSPPRYGPEPPPTIPPSSSSLALALFDDAKRGREMLTQPSLWLDEEVAAALRRAMDMKHMGQAERLIVMKPFASWANDNLSAGRPTLRWCWLINLRCHLLLSQPLRLLPTCLRSYA